VKTLILEDLPEAPVLVIGTSGLDLIGRSFDVLQTGTSNPGRLRLSPGGVARNVAENLARLGLEVVLITAVGDDQQGQQILDTTRMAGVNVDHSLKIPDHPTGSYLAILDELGNLHLGMDDMRISDSITAEFLREKGSLFAEASAVFLDANLPEATLRTAMTLAHHAGIPIAADPTSVKLAPRLQPFLEKLWLITLNEREAGNICPHSIPHADREQAIDAAKHLVNEGVEIAIIAMAEFGVGYATAESTGHIPAIKTDIVDPTGAGDALSAAVIFALLNNIPIDEAVRLGVSAASLTLRSLGTVAPDLSLERLYEEYL
jgi:pseudouridine kinase